MPGSTFPPAELSFAQPRPRSCALYRAHAVVDEPRFFNLEGDIGPGPQMTRDLLGVTARDSPRGTR